MFEKFHEFAEKWPRFTYRYKSVGEGLSLHPGGGQSSVEYRAMLQDKSFKPGFLIPLEELPPYYQNETDSFVE